MGLPLAREASAAGLSVIGLDISPEVVDGLNQGRSHVDDLADSDIAEMLRRGFFATSDAGQLRRARTIVICVPTPLSNDGAPDLDPLRRAVAICGRKTPARHPCDLGIYDLSRNDG